MIFKLNLFLLYHEFKEENTFLLLCLIKKYMLTIESLAFMYF